MDFMKGIAMLVKADKMYNILKSLMANDNGTFLGHHI